MKRRKVRVVVRDGQGRAGAQPGTAWPRHRYPELSPKHWLATRARLRPEELAAPLSAFEIPGEMAAPSDDARPAAQ
jgi:hypothetical protein